MEQIKHLVDVFIHLDHHVSQLIAACGNWSYALIFAIIFCETGLIFIPFLPGDSLLFVLGALAAVGNLNIWLMWGLLVVAAILGDTVNYFVGTRMITVVKRANQTIIKPAHLQKTQAFFEKHGPKTIILARFLPVIRTVAPFLAGVGGMNYRKFLLYNIVGAVLWVTIGLWAGWFFGNLPWVQKNFSLVVLAIVVISILPVAFEYFKHKNDRPAIPPA